MYKWFEIRDFRCFRKFNLSDLDRVNLIAGVNNIGKTAFLEAMFLHCGAYNPVLAQTVNAFRGIQAVRVEPGPRIESFLDSLFKEFDVSKIIEFEGEDTVTGNRSLRLRMVHKPSELEKMAQFLGHAPDETKVGLSELGIAQVLELEYQERDRRGRHYMILDQKGVRIEPIPLPPPFPAFFQPAGIRMPSPEAAEIYGRLEIQGKQDVVLQVLRVIEPRLSRLAMVVLAGQPVLHGDIGFGRLLPLPVMGNGMVRLAHLVLHITNAPNGVGLIDEIENGLHHSIMTKVWQVIGQVARQFNTQVFATTHSLECIVAAHSAFKESGIYDFRLHRLERINETIQAVTYNEEALAAAVETGLEVR
jgi:predicted ATPase